MDRSALRLFAWNLLYAEALVRDLTDEQWSRSAGPGLENHPAWTLGHLVTGADMIAQGLGLPSELPDGWADRFQRRGPGDTRLPEEGDYPSREEVLAELRRQHERVERRCGEIPAGEWTKEEDWAFGRDLPTFADGTLFMALAHEAMHLGQIAAWRRAQGLPSAMLSLARERAGLA